MKKIVFLMIILAVLATGCSQKKKSKSLNYNDSDPISMVLRGNRKINVSSDYDISYRVLNNDPTKTVIEVSSGGVLYGKNVGEDQVFISNGYESKTIDVKVDLFTEPTFEFGCNPNRIKSLYGNPYYSGFSGENLVYIYTSDNGYSYACGEMDFLFKNNSYFQSILYIRKGLDGILNNYLDENFVIFDTVQDTVTATWPTTHDTIITRHLYKNKLDESIICGKQPALNQWEETVLFYIRVDENSRDNSLKMRPLSSKFLY